MDNLNSYLQFIDPPLLQHDLLASLYYSSFPPLYDLIVGVMLKLFGASPAAFAILHLLVGWAIGLVLYALMADLRIGPRLAAAATLLFMILPPVILYENWLFYTYFETLFFLLAVWSFHRFIVQPRAAWGLTLFASAAALALLNARMMFYVFVIALLLWWAWRRAPRDLRRARLVALCATPFLLVLLVMAKNVVLFGAFTVDPHFGFHMGNGFVYAAWRDPDIHALCEQDYPLLLIPPAKLPPDAKIGFDLPAPTGIPLLDQPFRSTGFPNYNSRYYLVASQFYSAELTNFIVHHPLYYARFVRRAFANYWEPANQYAFFTQQNRARLGLYDYLYGAAYPLLLALNAVGALYVIYVGGKRRWADAETATLAFALAAIAYTMLAIFVTLGENDRYKFTVEPLLWVFVVYAIQQILRHGKAEGGGSGTPGPT
jgi:4-amino-4-deoxy-L-arabinose transferase-like glycosyltransferase